MSSLFIPASLIKLCPRLMEHTQYMITLSAVNLNPVDRQLNQTQVPIIILMNPRSHLQGSGVGLIQVTITHLVGQTHFSEWCLMPGSLTLWTLQRALVTATSLYLWLYKLVDPISTCTRHHVLPIHKVIVWAFWRSNGSYTGRFGQQKRSCTTAENSQILPVYWPRNQHVNRLSLMPQARFAEVMAKVLPNNLPQSTKFCL